MDMDKNQGLMSLHVCLYFCRSFWSGIEATTKCGFQGFSFCPESYASLLIIQSILVDKLAFVLKEVKFPNLQFKKIEVSLSTSCLV